MAYYALLKFHILPHVLFSLPENERAFIYAAIAVKAKADKQAADKAKRK
jgi:hypothetical protein|nr:MAG TPA: hypothetical protein [Caudoviricetes sp.]